MQKSALNIFWLSCGVVISWSVSAQDSSFNDNYRHFRGLVDKYFSYSFFIVPYQSGELIPIQSYSVDLAKTFHFLKRKKVISRSSDFVVAVFIDSLQIDFTETASFKEEGMRDFYEERREDSSNFGYRRPRPIHPVQQFYHYTYQFTVAVGVGQENAFLFPLGEKQKLITGAAINLNKPFYSTGFIQALDNVLRDYRNRYIDRVDW